MEDYQTFNKNRLFILLPDGTAADAPTFIHGAKKKFRYSDADSILYKQCSACGKWFKVAQFKDGQWVDIHLEQEIHFTSSTYSSYCRKYYSVKQKNKNKQIPLNSSGDNQPVSGSIKIFHISRGAA